MNTKQKTIVVGAAVFLLIILTSKKTSAMSVNLPAEKLVRRFEASNDVKKYLQAYQDSAGIWTIGWGSTYHQDLKRPVREGDVITEQTALRWMRNTLATLMSRVKALIKVPVNVNEEGALVSLVYNIGIGAFSKSTLLRLLNSNAPRIQVADQFLVWNKITDPVTKKKIALAGLTNRRIAERTLFLTPA